jgi:hypothetical protein
VNTEPFSRLARHGHIAAHHARELAGDGQPRAAKALRRRGLAVERREAVSRATLQRAAEKLLRHEMAG